MIEALEMTEIDTKTEPVQVGGDIAKNREFKLVNIFDQVHVVTGRITEVEGDCIHIKTIDGKNICISR